MSVFGEGEGGESRAWEVLIRFGGRKEEEEEEEGLEGREDWERLAEEVVRVLEVKIGRLKERDGLWDLLEVSGFPIFLLEREEKEGERSGWRGEAEGGREGTRR